MRNQTRTKIVVEVLISSFSYGLYFNGDRCILDNLGYKEFLVAQIEVVT